MKLDTAKLDEMIRTNPAKISNVVFATAARILTQARMVTPRDPARPPKDPDAYKPSRELMTNSNVVKVGVTQVNVEYYQEYAPYQEYGAPAINLPARPFLTPSVEKNAAQFEKDIAKVIDQ
jgi:hypothetical protein